MSNESVGRDQRPPGNRAYVIAYAVLVGLVWFAALSIVLAVIGL